MAAQNSLTDVLNAARTSAGNGGVVFGFVSSTDPGLSRNEYVVVPAGSTMVPRGVRPQDVDDPDFPVAFLECLLSDAATVASFSVPDGIKPWIAANRAYSYAAGYLGSESIVAGNAYTDLEKATIISTYAHLIPSASITPGPGTLGVFLCSMNYFCSNHNTTGSMLPKGQLKAIRASVPAALVLTNEQITRACYLAGHACEKRITLKFILPNGMNNRLLPADAFREVASASADAWATVRLSNGLAPAGTAILGLLKVCLTEVAKCGLLGIRPAPQAVNDLKAGVALVYKNPCAYHPGARYLFGIDPVVLADVENLKHHLGVFGGFCFSAGLATSVTASVHVAQMINERKDPFWFNLGKKFAKGVEASDAAVNAAMSAVGTAYGVNIPDPSVDAVGYGLAVANIRAQLDEINLNVPPVGGEAIGGVVGNP